MKQRAEITKIRSAGKWYCFGCGVPRPTALPAPNEIDPVIMCQCGTQILWEGRPDPRRGKDEF